MKPKKRSIRIAVILLTVTSLFIWHSEIHAQSFLLPLEYIGLIQQKLNSHFIYPPEARLKGWEGIVKVRFTLHRDGRLKEIDIAESSGYPLLDAAAILAIRDASPYPFPKDYTEEDEVEIILPVNYKQTQSPLSPISKRLPTTAQAKPQESLTSALVLTGPAPAPVELNNFIALALKNNQPTRVAREEVELAQIKVIEARRNLFPGLKISSYYTDGEVYKVDYEEQEAKVELNQALFYGGKLIDTIKQARVNLDITKKNYDRLKLDVVQKTETAYYNLVAAKMLIKLKDALLQEAKEMLEKIESLFKVGMVIPLEVNSARSAAENIQLQFDSVKQDLDMAELTFKQVLNIKETPEIETAKLSEAKKLNIDLFTCKETAFQHRPEVYLSELLVKFNDYGQRIKRSESNALTVDLTSSYGQYKGHYKTEPWKDSSNWFVGIKVSKPWGASTINTSYNTEETQPRFGQTSATASKTLSAEFNLLDNMKRLSEKKRSDIDMLRSLSDFNETFKTITFEVQDAFLAHQKAVLELNASQTEMEFRNNEAEVVKIRALTGEDSLSNAMRALLTLSDAQSKYVQALANYHISLANLKKATGYGIQI